MRVAMALLMGSIEAVGDAARAPRASSLTRPVARRHCGEETNRGRGE
jgi:hypothetical protein